MPYRAAQIELPRRGRKVRNILTLCAALLLIPGEARAADQIPIDTVVNSCAGAVKKVDQEFLAYLGRDGVVHFLGTKANLARDTYLFDYCMDRAGYPRRGALRDE